jgi:hypothetical protein
MKKEKKRSPLNRLLGFAFKVFFFGYYFRKISDSKKKKKDAENS